MNPERIFIEHRRQPFIAEGYYASKLERINVANNFHINAIQSGYMDVEGQRVVLTKKGKESSLEALANHHLEHLILSYTAGEPIEELRDVLEEVVSAWEDVARETGVVAGASVGSCFSLEYRTEFHQFMSMVGLAVLLHREDLLPRLDGLIPGYKEGDAVYEEIIKPFIKNRNYTDVWYHTVPYKDALGAVDSHSREEKSALMKRAVESWYAAHEAVPFHDTHKAVSDEGSGGYVGYWCFELAALCYLHQIDDGGFKEALVYPKDLVDWARKYAASPESLAPTAPERPPVLSAAPGSICPKEGLWFAPHLQMKEIHMKQGEVFPAETHGPTGAVTWYFKG